MRNIFIVEKFKQIESAEEKRKIFFLNYITYFGLLVLLLFSVRAFIEKNTILGISNSITLLIVVVSYIHMYHTNSSKLASYISTTAILFLFSYLVFSGGSGNSGYLWIYSFPLISVFLLGFSIGFGYSLILGIFICLIIFQSDYTVMPRLISFKLRVVGVYSLVLASSLMYENIRRKTQKLLEDTSNDLIDEKNQTDSIMDNVQQGIFLLDNNFKFTSKYSIVLEAMFKESALSEKSFLEILESKISQRDLNATKDYLEMFFNSRVNPDLLEEINPLEKIELNISNEEKGFSIVFFEFNFSLITHKDGIQYILGTVKDVTEEAILNKRLKEEETKSSRQMEWLFQIVHVDPEMINEFITDTEEELVAVNKVLKSSEKDYSAVLNLIYQSVHSIKGNAHLLGLKAMGDKLHKIEDQIHDLIDRGCKWSQLLEITIQLSEIHTDINDIKYLISKILSFQNKYESTEILKTDLLVHELKNTVEKLSEELKKEVDIITDDFHSSVIDKRYRKVIKDVCIQLARNAVAHGIEHPEERIKNRKKRKGSIYLATKKEVNSLNIIFKDDGKGFDIEAIRQKAMMLKQFKHLDIENMSQEKIISLIFYPGFSTLETPEMIAGRGIGLNLIKTRIEKHGGKLKVRYFQGKSCEFHLKLPLN